MARVRNGGRREMEVFRENITLDRKKKTYLLRLK